MLAQWLQHRKVKLGFGFGFKLRLGEVILGLDILGLETRFITVYLIYISSRVRVRIVVRVDGSGF